MSSDKRTTDIQKPDGIFSRGDTVGHADRESHIRKKDGLIFKGEEIGYVDKNKQIRRPDGVIFRGDVVGQVKKGDRAHAEDGIIFAGEEWGYVDDDGNVRLRDGMLFKGRIIGKMRGHNKEAALGYYVLRFKNIEDRFEKLEEEAGWGTNKSAVLSKVRGMLGYVPETDALGDFDGLIRRLRELEQRLVREIETTRDSHRRKKDELIHEAERLRFSTAWKETAAQLRALQEQWKSVGSAGRDVDDRLWERFRAAQDTFYQKRSEHFERQKEEWAANLRSKEALCSEVEDLADADDVKAAVERVKQLQAKWKGIGHVQRDSADGVWDRFRSACDRVFAHSREVYERRNEEWRARMRESLEWKERKIQELEESIEHDEGNVSRWQDTIDNLHEGGRADEIRDSLEGKIASVEEKISNKRERVERLKEELYELEKKLAG